VILYRWHGSATNFGDELNTLIWPALLPGFFDSRPDAMFLGIGSVLDRRHPPDVLKLVAGSGYGGYEARVRLDSTWVVHWVRGPRSAAAVGLATSFGLGDPAVLLPQVVPMDRPPPTEIGFMPHFESAERGAWRQAAMLAGLTLIDPRDPPLAVMRAIGRCKLLLSEALHGAIVADAMRVPWIAVRPLARIHRPKWQDWADTLDLDLRFGRLGASTLYEWTGASVLSSWHNTRTWMQRQAPCLQRVGADRLLERAAKALCRLAAEPAQQSRDTALDRCQSRMLDAVAALRVEPFRTAVRSPAAGSRSRLHRSDESAYHLSSIG
jgi:succinoglycan biosynthesis protein ExoV